MEPATSPNGALSASITDIRRHESHDDLAQDIRRLLRPVDGGEKRLPTILLYDEAGLKLFEEITYLDEYYLTNAEIEVLESYAQSLAQRIPHGAAVIELGSGNLRKVSILLEALDAAQKDIDYYALDLSKSELERTLQAVPPDTYAHVRCHGLHGTYDDGLAWLQRPENRDRPKCIMTLGSSVGNFDIDGAAAFLGSFAKCLSPKDVMIVAADNCQDPERVYVAYNDTPGVTHRFVLNGLLHANQILGYEAFELGVWSVIGEYDVDAGRHQAFVTPNKDVQVEGVKIAVGERIRIEESYKFSQRQADNLWKTSGLACVSTFADSTGTYRKLPDVNMLSRPSFVCSLNPKEYAATAVPSYQDWAQLWGAWDLVTRKMIPEDELLTKPIKLRNCCVFYLGHIPTFLDIHLTRATDGKPTSPSYYPNIFERGIDPDVDDPEQCHDHSEIPEEWPPVAEVLQYQKDVRERVRRLYEDGSIDSNVKLRRVLPLGFEHEVMHLETFLYMLLQSEHVVAPSQIHPDFAALAEEASTKAVPNEWFKIPASKVTLGREDREDDYTAGHFFGWDNESPAVVSQVSAFEAQGRPLTNSDYACYMIAKGITAGPSSWTADLRPDSGYGGSRNSPSVTGDIDQEQFDEFIRGKAVRTVFGPVPLKLALDWPVFASYDELAGCASYFGGRIPTLEEARSIYSFAEQQHQKDLGQVSAQRIPAVNGHLSNNGVHQTPPAGQSSVIDGGAVSSDALSEQAAAVERKDLFADLSSANVGFTHFHPMPVTHAGNRLAGLGEMGGVWEWTSSPLQAHEGFKAMDLYPGYTSDFFDEKHNVVLGGSWATHPRVAGRKTFVNWYQRNYPYVWAGARLVRDI